MGQTKPEEARGMNSKSNSEFHSDDTMCEAVSLGIKLKTWTHKHICGILNHLHSNLTNSESSVDWTSVEDQDPSLCLHRM